MLNQETLDRIAALKQEIAELRKTAQPAPKAYALASRPNRYITTEEDAEEYFELFKRFLSVYQEYRQKE